MKQQPFIVKIDGVEIPPPSSYEFWERDLHENATRNAAGVASWDVVRFNVGEIQFTWRNISGENLKKVISAIRSKKSFDVTFLNPNTGSVETRTFYSGDRATEMTRYISILEYYSTLTVSFVEV